MRRYKSVQKNISPTIAAILGYIYRKQKMVSFSGRYGQGVIAALVEMGLVKVTNQGYYKTEISKEFKAMDFAKEYLWAFHNVSGATCCIMKSYTTASL